MDPDGRRLIGAVRSQPRVHKKHGLLRDWESGGHPAVVSEDSQKKQPSTKAHSSQGLLLNQNSSWEGVLRNDRKKKPDYQVEGNHKNVQLCDPKLDEADVGLLSCGFNYYCAESHDSYLGGVCVDAVNGSNQQPRRLEDGSDGVFDVVGACDPSSPYFSQCNCTMFDSVSGDGYIKCLYDDNYCVKECRPALCAQIHVGGEVRIRLSILPIARSNQQIGFANDQSFLCYKGDIQHDQEHSLLLQFYWGL